jgi:CheY-like chemotaxis protein
MNTPEKINVLIVDDNAVDIFIAEEVLKHDFKTFTVSSGPAALEAIEKEKFDIILMDINLNDHTMDGISAMRKIKYQPKHKRTKIIAVTSSSDAKEWYIKQGFDGHHMKPLSRETILEEIMLTLNRACVLLV